MYIYVVFYVLFFPARYYLRDTTLFITTDFLAENPKIVVEIDGHTSNRGKAEKNLKLSWKRGLAVIEYLKSQGIEGIRMVPRGFGSKRPRAQSRVLTRIGRELNERIEMRIMSLE